MQSIRVVLYFQLKCTKSKDNDNLFEIELISGTYTSGWQLCGLRLFEGGKFLSFCDVLRIDSLQEQKKRIDKARPIFLTLVLKVIGS